MIHTVRRTYFHGKKVSRENIQEAAVVSVVRGDGDLDHSSVLPTFGNDSVLKPKVTRIT